MKPKAVLTIDLEFWYNSEFLKKHLSQDVISQHSDRIKEEVSPLLKLLAEHEIKATFFVLGQLAEKYPEVIKLIADLGHGIASHGYSHKSLNDLTPTEFETEIKKTDRILTDIVGKKAIGFRAPAFSLNHKTKWALPILQKHGYKYNSSIFPVNTLNKYKINNIPFEPYYPSFERINTKGTQRDLLEIPPAAYNLGSIKIPVAGGIYFQYLPINLYIELLKIIASKRIPVLYFHPCDLQNFIPDIKAPKWKIAVKYWGVKNTQLKFKKLLQEFQFDSIENTLKFLRQ